MISGPNVESKSIKYSFIVCINNEHLFDQFVLSLEKTSIENHEIISINNKVNKFTLPQALNLGAEKSSGDFRLFCHQDILFTNDWLDKVTRQIELVSKNNINWGVLGVMGVKQNGFFAGNIRDPHTCVKIGSLPCEVASLDEVCLILRKDSSLQFDEKLGGFHLYGADICLQANQMGLKCYAIDAPFEHLSPGNIDDSFYEIAEKLRSKWSCVKGSPCVIETTCGVFQLKDGLVACSLYYFKIFARKIIRRIQGRWRKACNAL